jgi:hypothetical protein
MRWTFLSKEHGDLSQAWTSILWRLKDHHKVKPLETGDKPVIDDPYEAIKCIPNLKRTKFKTPGGKAGRPFQVLKMDDDMISVRTSRGGRVSLRQEVFQVAEQLLRDLGEKEEGHWVLLSDDILTNVLRGQNRDNACSSYVFPLLEATGRIEIDRSRPVKLRLAEDQESAE